MGAETVTDCGGRAGCAAGGRGYVGVSSYCQILWGEAGQPGETAPGRRAVQLLHLLCQLLLEPPLFLILLCVRKLHHHWGRAALLEQNESARENTLKKVKAKHLEEQWWCAAVLHKLIMVHKHERAHTSWSDGSSRWNESRVLCLCGWFYFPGKRFPAL